MTYNRISCYQPINDVDPSKVYKIAESIKKNGFVGCPILVYGEMLITGSHRLAALRLLLDEGYDVENLDVAEDVTDIVENAILDFEEENGYSPDIDFSDISWMFAGTWVEEYKDEINEW